VIGCGNALRGDDAVGPMLIERLAAAPIPEGVVLVDGGTDGLGVAATMRSAHRVIIVDAASTGQPPGTILRVPGEELVGRTAPAAFDTHRLGWNHALSLGHWLLGDDYPDEVTVFLIEIARTDHGTPLSGAVAGALDRLEALITVEWMEEVA
jgi:hydrogenase maturation protease